jgi:Family of unknown function (DUF6328)
MSAGGAQDRRVKTALDETRLLILGAQILFGFHLNGAFQKGFSDLSTQSRALHALSFLMMAAAIALLIAPSLQHRLVEGGNASSRIINASTLFAGLALLPFALSLGVDLYIVIGHRFGAAIGATAGVGFTALAMAAWYGAEWLLQRPKHNKPAHEERDTPIDVRVEHMLTEARVLLPGAQALLGFQLAVMLTDAFGELAFATRVIHVAALCCTCLAVILLMAPAAFHRITYNGENTESFHRLGSALVLAAAVPLGGGIVGDLYVAVEKGLHQPAIAAAVAAVAFVGLVALWLIQPLMLRAKRQR